MSASQANQASATNLVSIHDLSKRFRSKKELHEFLVFDGDVYLPKKDSVSIEFLKLVINGKKSVSGASRVDGSILESFKALSH